MSDRVVNEIWGGSHVKWLSLDAIGAVGGVSLLGDCRQISVVSTWKGAFSVSAIVEDLAAKFKWLVISVYGPNDIAVGVTSGGSLMTPGVLLEYGQIPE